MERHPGKEACSTDLNAGFLKVGQAVHLSGKRDSNESQAAPRSVVPSSTKSQSHGQSHRLMGMTVMTVKFHLTFLRVNLQGRLGKTPDLV